MHLAKIVGIYRDKYDTIIQKETSSFFGKGCLIIFITKDVPTMINGQSRKRQSVVFCFPKINTKDIIKVFKKLFLKKYLDAVDKEPEMYKIQKLSPLHNMAVKYYSPYQLYSTPKLSELPITYANLNANGITYNTKDVNK